MSVKSPCPIKVIALDIDGVLTDGTVTWNATGDEYKTISYHDIDAVFEARRRGFHVCLITAEDTAWVDFIARRLSIDHVERGAKDKCAALERLARILGVRLHEICYIGDGDRDAPALMSVGIGFAPCNATSKAKEAAKIVLNAEGGRGVVSEVLHHLS